MDIYRDMGYSIGGAFVMTALVSLLGFLIENIWLTARKGYIDNRNMHAPFLLGYGLTIMGFYAVLGTPSNLRLFGEPVDSGPKSQFGAYFLLTFILVSVGEIALGKFVEKTCRIIWWDYTKIPLHITRYTSVPTSLGFTIGIVVFMDCFFEPVMDKLMEKEPVRLTIFGTILMAGMTVDYLVSAVRMLRTHELLTTWRVDFRTRSVQRYRHNEPIKN